MIMVDSLNSQPELGVNQVTCMVWSDTGKDELLKFMREIGVYGFKVFYIKFTRLDLKVEYCRLTPSQRECAISNNAVYQEFENYVKMRENSYQFRLF